MTSDLSRALALSAKKVGQELEAVLSEQTVATRLNEAMRYALLGEAKRIRPFLVLQSASLFGVDEAIAMPAAISLECLHCYSLIHDDLPAMDDDALRRGKPALHIAFDEATAILAGDALLTLSFEILAQTKKIPSEAKLNLINELAGSSGARGMVGGQMLDLAAEGRFDKGASLKLDEKAIAHMQSKKTGALLRYALRAGGILGEASESQMGALTNYGEKLGLLFQLSDDLIDATGTEKEAGKLVAKDRDKGKATLVSLLGIAGARERLKFLAEDTKAQLRDFENAVFLNALPDYLTQRVL